MKKLWLLPALIALLCAPALAESGFVFPSEGGRYEAEFEIDIAGEYNLAFDYASVPSDYLTIEISLLIDGEPPFPAAERLSLSRPWTDTGAIVKDSRGNDVLPRQALSAERRTELAKDREFTQNEPYVFTLGAGKHTLSISADRGDFMLYGFSFVNIAEAPDYADYRALHPANIPEREIIIEAEHMSARSDSSLVAIYVRNDASVSPSNAYNMLINAAGGSSWSTQGQWLSWSVEIPEDGWYATYFKAKQAYKSGISVYRRLIIDGEIPFAEAGAIAFPASESWTLISPGSVYLREGTHEIVLEVVPGPMAESSEAVSDVLRRLNALYRGVVALTGETIDAYRDYELDDAIPNLLPELIDCANALGAEYDRLLKLSGKGGSEIAVISRLRDELIVLAEEPDQIPGRISAWKSNIDALAAWLISIRESPIDLDQIVLTPEGRAPTYYQANFFSRLGYRVSSLLASFSVDYGTIGDVAEGDALEVWIGLGRDQLGVLKDLIDERFTPETGIKVNVNLVQQGLTEAILADSAPDVALYVGSPDLAYRGALLKLDQFGGFAALASEFNTESLVQDTYRGHIYGIPLIQSFPVLFIAPIYSANWGLPRLRLGKSFSA